MSTGVVQLDEVGFLVRAEFGFLAAEPTFGFRNGHAGLGEPRHSWDSPGLVPTERSSGETIRRGHITKAGSTVVRTQSSNQRGPINTGPGLGRGCVNASRTSPPTP
ncbi:MAG TPA: hypothetical protein VF926_12545 [Mycobacterium sp.]